MGSGEGSARQGPCPATHSPSCRPPEPRSLSLFCTLQVYEVVRPLVGLLHLKRTALENFEGLMALTNLAGTSERLR